VRSARGVVVDASVALAAVLLEPLHSQALAVLEKSAAPGSRGLCPDVFDTECAAGIVKAVRQGRLDTGLIERTWSSVAGLPLDRHPATEIGADALQVALDHGISAYDAMYVALSLSTGLPLVTADNRLVRMLSGTGCELIPLDEITVT
jgi:predicted nucleic acid-binding protein